jgi:hypothetical protein
MENISDYLQNNSSLNIIVDAHNYNIQDDRRFLVPFMIYEHNDIHFGFADRNGKIVIPAIYDKVFDNFNSETDLVRVGKRFIVDYGTKEKPRQYKYFYCGVINAKGEELIPCNKYRELYFTEDNLLIVHGERMGGECALIDLKGNEIIPYKRFSNIYPFVNGFARARTLEKKWVVIDLSGNVIIQEGEVDWVWNLSNEYSHIVVERNKRKYQIPFETLQKRQNELATQGMIITPIEECLIYQEYLQKDFTKASSIELGEIYF